MIELNDPGKMEPRVWTCKIGGTTALPIGGSCDAPMREAIERAYREITGQEPDFTFSGWGGELTEGERATVEDRMPDPYKVLREIDDAIEMRESTLAYIGHSARSPDNLP